MLADQIAKDLLQIKAIKLSPHKPFTWASGLKSPIYCDNRKVLSHPTIRHRVIEAFIEKSRAWVPFDLIAGVATAGIAHAALIADRMDLPMVYIRPEAKKHGLGNQIEGSFETGQRALVIEDLFSTGTSSLQAVQAWRQAGGKVVGVLAIFSYQLEVCAQAFSEAQCLYASLSDYPTLLRIAIQSGYIQHQDENTLWEWAKNPKAWSEAHS
jgi:orotate phosphoribosyltransferase